MDPIADEEFDRLLSGFERDSVHLEMRDAYGTAVELPHMAQWAAGEVDDLEWLQGWCSTLRRHVRSGRSVRRARIVSEPLSDYQRWSHSIEVAAAGAHHQPGKCSADAHYVLTIKRNQPGMHDQLAPL